MELTERKKKVLRSVVDLYIRTAEPVGSKAITELPDMKETALAWADFVSAHLTEEEGKKLSVKLRKSSPVWKNKSPTIKLIPKGM